MNSQQFDEAEWKDDARAFVQWVPGRGTKARGFGLEAAGDSPDHALAMLMAALEKAPLLK